MISLNDVISWFGDAHLYGNVPESFSELILQPWCAEHKCWLYVPEYNALYDGREKITEAFELGAGAVVIDRDWFSTHRLDIPAAIVVNEEAYSLLLKTVQSRRDRFKGDIFAVTGSVGKTTTRELLSSFLRGDGNVCATIENGNSNGGQCEILLRSQKSDKYVVSELGIAHPGEMRNLCRLLQPTVAILTTIGDAHMVNYRNREQLARAKISIFKRLWGDRPFGVVSRDIDYIELVREITNVPLVEVSLKDSGAQYYGEVLDAESGTMRVHEAKSKTSEVLTIGRPGRHLCHNALLAYAAAREVGVTPQQCRNGLLTFQVPGNRWSIVKRNGVTFIDDSFNASTLSMKAVLDNVKTMKGRKIIVFGDMLELGDFSEARHREVGKYVVDAKPDEFVTVGDMACAWMAGEYEKYALTRKAHRAKTSAEAREIISKMAKPGDTIILKASHGVNLSEVLS